MSTFERGDIWIVDFEPSKGREQRGQRPAVIMSSDYVNAAAMEILYVLPGTTTETTVPNHIRVQPSKENGLARVTFFMAEQLRAVSTQRLRSRVGTLQPSYMADIENVLLLLLDLAAK